MDCRLPSTAAVALLGLALFQSRAAWISADDPRLFPELSAELLSFVTLGTSLYWTCALMQIHPWIFATDASSSWQAEVKPPLPAGNTVFLRRRTCDNRTCSTLSPSCRTTRCLPRTLSLSSLPPYQRTPVRGERSTDPACTLMLLRLPAGRGPAGWPLRLQACSFWPWLSGQLGCPDKGTKCFPRSQRLAFGIAWASAFFQDLQPLLLFPFKPQPSRRSYPCASSPCTNCSFSPWWDELASGTTLGFDRWLALCEQNQSCKFKQEQLLELGGSFSLVLASNRQRPRPAQPPVPPRAPSVGLPVSGRAASTGPTPAVVSNRAVGLLSLPLADATFCRRRCVISWLLFLGPSSCVREPLPTFHAWCARPLFRQSRCCACLGATLCRVALLCHPGAPRCTGLARSCRSIPGSSRPMPQARGKRKLKHRSQPGTLCKKEPGLVSSFLRRRTCDNRTCSTLSPSCQTTRCLPRTLSLSSLPPYQCTPVRGERSTDPACTLMLLRLPAGRGPAGWPLRLQACSFWP